MRWRIKFDQRGKPVCFRAGNASVTLSAACQRGYFNNKRVDAINFGKVGHVASLERRSMVHLISWNSRDTDRETVTNYCVTDAP